MNSINMATGPAANLRNRADIEAHVKRTNFIVSNGGVLARLLPQVEGKDHPDKKWLTGIKNVGDDGKEATRRISFMEATLGKAYDLAGQDAIYAKTLLPGTVDAALKAPKKV